MADKFLQYGSSRSNNHGVPGIFLEDVFRRFPKSWRDRRCPSRSPSRNTPFHDCAPAYQKTDRTLEGNCHDPLHRRTHDVETGLRHRRAPLHRRAGRHHPRRLPALARVRQVRTRGQPLRHRRDRADARLQRRTLRLQVRQRPSQQHPARHVHRDGLRRAGRRGHRLSGTALGADRGHRAAHLCHLADGSARPGPSGLEAHGADRQRRPERVPGAGLPHAAGHRGDRRL